MTDDEDSGVEERYTVTKYPIRLWVKDKNGLYVEGAYINVTLANDSFYIDLAENVDSLYNCLYDGVLFNSAEGLHPKPMDTKASTAN